MAKKIGLKGFSNFRFFPVEVDKAEEYKTSSGISLKHVLQMTREIDETEQKIYADDSLYMNIKNFNGIKASITVAELSLNMRALLGDGEYNEKSGVFTWLPDKEKPIFACTYMVNNTSGGARLYRLYSFMVEGVKESMHKTMGENVELQTFDITGTFVKRKLDQAVGAFIDVGDLTDLSFIEEPHQQNKVYEQG